MPIVGKFPRRRNKQIPAWIGFQATAGDNTLHLRPQTGGFDCTIDWGDGSKTVAPVNGGNVIHSYASAGLYDIKLRGKSFAGFCVNNQAGKEKYVAAYSMGEWENTAKDFSASFYGCLNLSALHKDIFKYINDVTNYQYFFNGTALKEIPNELFWRNDKALSFSFCFARCKNLTSIPYDLFKFNIAATGFSYVFSDCENIAVIPDRLFFYNVNAISFEGCFNRCNFIKIIPIDLFRYNTEVTSFSYCFNGCSSLTTLPTDLFRYNTAVTDFSYCFFGCDGLTAIPRTLFRYNTAVTNFGYCFTNCTNLLTVLDDFFAYNIAATNFDSCFQGCTKLALRFDMFGLDYANRFNGKSINFSYCFSRSYFTGLQGIAPILWNFTGLTATKTKCFGGAGNNVSSISNYSSIPADWIN